MKRAFAFTVIAFLVFAFTVIAQKGLKVQDLPPAVQRTVQEQIKGAELKGISKEVEKGKIQYEIETITNHKTRDILIDSSGAIVEIEEETTLDAIPAAAKAAAGGKITKVETVTKGEKVAYEAAITKGGKSLEVSVTADGNPAK